MFKGEPNEEIYTKKIGSEVSDAKNDMGYMLLADVIS